MDARTMSEVTTDEIHDWGARCDRCGGIGFRSEEERSQMPGCPMSLDFELPLGPEGLKLAKAREVSERRNAGHDIQQARKAAGLTQAQLASKAGVTRSVVAMGEAGGVWGKEALRKVRQALGLPTKTDAQERQRISLGESSHLGQLAQIFLIGDAIRAKWMALSWLHSMSEAQMKAANHRLALSGELGERAKQDAERYDWCAKVSQQTPHTAEHVQYLLHCFDENREALLGYLGVTQKKMR